MKKPETPIYPKLIPNSPCGIDKMGGAHKMIADNIVKHIKKYDGVNKNSFKLIGLDGSWGSGKSNVIKMLEEDELNPIMVFTYDAWAHQEDLQRRSFLEELTDFLVQQQEKGKNVFKTNKRFSEKCKEGKTWKESLEDLLSKNKKTTTNTIPKVNPFVIAAVFITFVCTPLFKFFLHYINHENCPAIEVFPAFLFGLYWMYMRYFVDEKYGKIDNLVYLARREDLVKVTDEVISENEPSVREFKKWVHAISDDLVDQVIIVFDNLDRLEKDKVKKLWSSINTFFSEETYTKFSVIVPFDRSKIIEVFDEENNYEKANHFIDKTFTIVYRVSPIVITEWKKYFSEIFSEAFGNSEDSEKNIVMNIFDVYEDSITPRKIISFINELVTLKLIWNSKISLKYMALFALNKTELVEKPIEKILSKQFLEKGKDIFGHDDELLDNISALVYNIDVEKASEIPLTEKIVSLFREQNGNELLTLSKKIEGFYLILDSVFRRREISVEDATLTLMNFRDTNIDSANKKILDEIWLKIINKQINRVKIDSITFNKVHVILISNANENNIEKLTKSFIRQYQSTPVFNGNDYFNALNELRNNIQKEHPKVNFDSINNLFKKQVHPNEFAEYVLAAKDEYKLFNIVCENLSLDQYLIEKVIEKNYKDTSILSFLKHDSNYSFPMLTKYVEDMINKGNVDVSFGAKLFDVYKNLCNSTLLPVQLSDESVFELLNNTNEKTDSFYEFGAMRLARYQNFFSSSGNSRMILQDESETTIKEIAIRIQSYQNFGDLIIDFLTWNTPLLKGVLKFIIKNDKGIHLAIEEIIPVSEKLTKELNIKISGFIRFLNKWESDLTINNDNILKVIPSIGLLHSIVLENNQISRKVLNAARDYIESISKEIWTEKLIESDSYEFQLLMYLCKNEFIDILSPDIIEAYKKILLNIASEEIGVPEDSDFLNTLYSLIDKHLLSNTIKSIRDLYRINVDINEESFLFFENLLRTNGDLLSQNNDIVRRIIIPVLDYDMCLQKIYDNKVYYIDLISNSGNEIYDFLSIMRDKAKRQSNDSEIHNFLKDLYFVISNKIKIEKAVYIVEEENGKTLNVKPKILKFIGDGILSILVSNDNIDVKDPKLGVHKKLRIEYTYDEQKKVKEAFEDHYIELP